MGMMSGAGASAAFSDVINRIDVILESWKNRDYKEHFQGDLHVLKQQLQGLKQTADDGWY